MKNFYILLFFMPIVTWLDFSFFFYHRWMNYLLTARPRHSCFGYTHSTTWNPMVLECWPQIRRHSLPVQFPCALIFLSCSKSSHSLLSRLLARTWLHFLTFTSSGSSRAGLRSCTLMDSAWWWLHVPPCPPWIFWPSWWGQCLFFSTSHEHTSAPHL